MSETDHSPFRRFPRVQLVFCIACLSMAAWTWMRYSYAWSYTEEELLRLQPPVIEESDRLHEPRWAGTYVSVVIVPERVFDGGFGYEVDAAGPDSTMDRLHVSWDHPPQWQPGDPYEIRGRLSMMPWRGHVVYVHTEASRFHAASVAGLVVGAMGCFVFGLYLRRWLQERRAA